VSAGLIAAAALLSQGTGSWPRGCAFLVRMELEEWVRGHSAKLDGNLSNANMRSQLMCLSQTVPKHEAVRAASAWYLLSAACHQHAYELAPTVGELRRLLNEVQSLTESRTPDVVS
jgi:hypothetical protein